MKQPKFLILLEGASDVTNISKIFSTHLGILLKNVLVNVIPDRGREKILIESEENQITIYIKNGVKQNLKNFNEELVENQSIEKLYEFDQSLTAIYSIYDYDPGSTTSEQCKDYFSLKGKHDNFYPILSYPGHESHYIQNYHKELYDNLNTIKKENLNNICSLMTDISVSETLIELNNVNNISKKIKKLYDKLKQTNELKPLKDTVLTYNKNLDYIYNLYDKDNYTYYLENQNEIFDLAVVNDKIKLSTFILCVLEDILAWIRDEDDQ